MIKEVYVSYETSKLLKEKGFSSDDCHTAYDEDKVFFWYGDYSKDRKGIVDAPTQALAMKWLREVHHWHIFVIPRWEDVEYMPGEWQEEMTGYQYVIVSIGEVNRTNEQPITKALTPESAYEAAIKYCLENLI